MKAHGVQADDNNYQGQNETGDGELTDGILAFLLDGTGLLGVVLGAWVVAGSTSSLEEEEKKRSVSGLCLCIWNNSSKGWLCSGRGLDCQG